MKEYNFDFNPFNVFRVYHYNSEKKLSIVFGTRESTTMPMPDSEYENFKKQFNDYCMKDLVKVEIHEED